MFNLKKIKMKKNMGTTDRTIRILVAVSVIILYFTNVISGTIGIVLLALSAVFIVTGILGFCPLYIPLSLSTRRQE